MKCAFALGATFLLLCTAPAMSQVYPGQEVTVNPGAVAGHGYLLYPGGKYGRFVGPLLEPGERRGPIHLHMPVKHVHVARRVKKVPPVAVASDTPPAASPDQFASTPDANTTPAPTPAPPPRRAKRVARHTPPPDAAPPAAAPPPPTSDISSLPENSAARLIGPTADMSSAPPPPAHRRIPPPSAPAAAPRAPAASDNDLVIHEVHTAPKPRRVASAPPPASVTPPADVAAGLHKQSSIPFAAGASSPAAADVNAVHSLATSLNAALSTGAQRVQLNAYGGPRGDKSSDAHRLSLKRALVIRELLIEDGVPAERIDVRALGGADDDGPADRVDVFVQA